MFIRILAILLISWWIFGGFIPDFKSDQITPPTFNGPTEAPDFSAPTYPPPSN